MVDKIGWTEPLDSKRGAVEIVTVPGRRMVKTSGSDSNFYTDNVALF